ncbi:GNAT family N-acetyltransferase [Herbaspirillum rubrisubalbicans]
MGEALHRESPRWSRLTYSRAKAADMLARLITQPWGLVLVAEVDGEIIGGIAAIATSHWSSTDVVAEEVSFFMKPEHRGSLAAARLICCMKKWAELKGAVWLHAGTSTGVNPERTAQLYEKLGFTRCAIGLEVLNDGN